MKKENQKNWKRGNNQRREKNNCQTEEKGPSYDYKEFAQFALN